MLAKSLSGIDKKVDELTEQLENIENKKLDKTGILSMVNMGQDVKEAMTGGSVAVVGKNTVLEENIVDEQVTFKKRTVLGSRPITFVGSGGICPNLDTVEKTITFISSVFIIIGNKRFTIAPNTVISYSEITAPAFCVILNTKDDKVLCLNSSQYNTLGEHSIILGVVSRTDSNKLIKAEFDFPITVNGVRQEDFLYPKKYTTKKCQLFCGYGGPLINLDTVNQKIDLPKTLFILVDGVRYTISQSNIPFIALNNYMVDNCLVYFDRLNNSFIASTTTSTPKNEYCLFCVIYRVEDRWFMNIDIDYTIDNKSTILPNEPTPTIINNDGIFISDDLEEVPTLKTMTSNDIYGLYDSLMESYPKFITKKLLGYGSTADGSEDMSLPIYEYTFSTAKLTNMTSSSGVVSYDSINALITSGVHGTEKNTVYSLYFFMKQMLNNHKTDYFLNNIQANVNFKIIPIVNPGGFSSFTYNNRHNVNINQNFSYKFDTAGDGAEPYSEPETKVLKKWFDDNKDTSDFYIDYHGFTNVKGVNKVTYFWSHNENINKIYWNTIKKLSNSWKDRIINAYVENECLGYVTNEWSERPSASVEFYKTYNFEMSSLLEMRRYSTTNGFNEFSKEILIIGTELFGNFLNSLLEKYFL